MYELTARWSKPPLSSVTAPGTQSAPLLLRLMLINCTVTQRLSRKRFTLLLHQWTVRQELKHTGHWQQDTRTHPSLGHQTTCSAQIPCPPHLLYPAQHWTKLNLQVKKVPPPHPTVYLWDRINFLGNLNRISCNLNSWTFKFNKEVTKFTF